VSRPADVAPSSTLFRALDSSDRFALVGRRARATDGEAAREVVVLASRSEPVVPSGGPAKMELVDLGEYPPVEHAELDFHRQ